MEEAQAPIPRPAANRVAIRRRGRGGVSVRRRGLGAERVVIMWKRKGEANLTKFPKLTSTCDDYCDETRPMSGHAACGWLICERRTTLWGATVWESSLDTRVSVAVVCLSPPSPCCDSSAGPR